MLFVWRVVGNPIGGRRDANGHSRLQVSLSLARSCVMSGEELWSPRARSLLLNRSVARSPASQDEEEEGDDEGVVRQALQKYVVVRLARCPSTAASLIAAI